MISPPISYFFCALVVSWLIAWAIRVRALQSNRLDIPNARSSHVAPTPTGGGLGIVVCCLLGALISALLWDARWAGLAAAVALLATISWLDDHGGIAQLPRLATQLVAATLAVVPFLAADWPSYWLLWPVVILAVTWFINLYNFMDGTDGLAASQTLIFTLAWHYLTATSAGGTWQHSELLVVTLSGATLGFLLLNWPPARIFMGDVGSTAIGLIIATVVVCDTASPGQLAAALILASGFIVDASWTLAYRCLSKQPFWQPHRLHAYQKFAQRSRSHKAPLLGYWLTGVLIQWPLAYAAYQSTGNSWLLYLLAAITIHIFACVALKAGSAAQPTPHHQ